MHRTPILTLILPWLATAGLAQQQAVSIPAFATTEAPASNTWFGSLPEARHQLLDGGFLGGGARLVTQVSFRADGKPVIPFAYERTWSQVVLRVAEGSLDGFSRNLDANNATPWATVYSAKTTWPVITGNPGPRVWGAHARFPFQSPWPYSGKQDLLQDYAFSGGTMPKVLDWIQPLVIPYDLDADGLGGTAVATFHVVGLQQCQDSGTTELPLLWAVGSVFAAGPAPKALAGRLNFDVFGSNTAPYGLLITAVSLSSLPNGIALPGVCQRLYVDLTMPYVTQAQVADALGATTFRFGTVPWLPAYAGVDVWTQGAFADSVSNVLSLSMACYARLPAQQINVYRRAWSLGVGANATVGGEPDPSAVGHPLFLLDSR